MPAASEPLRDYVRVQRTFDARLNALLEATARDIQSKITRLESRTGIGAEIRSAQLRTVLSEIRQEQISMWTDGVQGNIAEGRRAAAQAAQSAYDSIASVAYASLPESVAETLSDSLQRSARAGIESAYARVPRALSERVYRNGVVASGQVEEIIQRGIASGLSAKELARDVYRYVSPTTPGGASYAATRLARTEINNAFHEQQKKAGLAPGVKGTKWNLSGSHPRPDDCNLFADRDVDDLGAGVYKPTNVPNKPHPHCLCYLTYVTMEPGEFAAELRKGSFDDELRRRTEMNLRRLKQDATPVAKAQTKKPVKKAKTPTTPAEKRAARRIRQAEIDRADNLAGLGVEIDRALSATMDGATRNRIIQQNLSLYKAQGGVSDSVYASLLARSSAGDWAGIRSEFERYATRRRLEPIGKAGDRRKFDPRYHETVEGGSFNPADGQTVGLLSRGYKFRPTQDTDALVLRRAVVHEVPDRPALDHRPMKRVRGEDLTEDVFEDTAPFYESTAAELHGHSDPIMTRLMRAQEFDGRPGIGTASDIDARIADGWTLVYRGVKPYKDQSASDLLDLLRGEGSFQSGTGIHGNGIYTSTRRATSEQYAMHREGVGEDGLIRMVISPKAKVVKHSDLLDEQARFLDDFTAENAEAIAREDPRVMSYLNIIEDEGRFAAMRGYDAVKVEGRQDGAGSTADQFIILNRTITIMEDAP